MSYSIKVLKKNFYILKNNKKLKTLNNKKPIFVTSKKLALTFIKEQETLKKKNFSISSLVLFSCDLNKSQRKIIINDLCKNLKFDNILYRPENNVCLKKKMDCLYNAFIKSFMKMFNLELNIFTQITKHQSNLNEKEFKIFLNKIDNFKLTLLFKLVNISKSVILSYNFIINKFGVKKFMFLYNFEYIYQKEKWGQVNDQKPIENSLNEELKCIQTFFKNL